MRPSDIQHQPEELAQCRYGSNAHLALDDWARYFPVGNSSVGVVGPQTLVAVK